MHRHDQGLGGVPNAAPGDDRIRQDVCERLEDADVDATEIEVNVRGGEVVLEGTVDDRWAKREAEDVACQARGVKDCHNRLKVQSSDPTQRPQPRAARSS